MAIDMRDLPLGLGPREPREGFATGGSKLAQARRRVVDAWLDDDAAGLAGAIDQGEREFGADADGIAAFRTGVAPLVSEFRSRRQLVRGAAERHEARSGLAATLGRLSQSVAASDDPARRDLLGREARGLIESHRAEGLLGAEDAEALAGDYDKGLGQAQAARIAREDPALAQQLLRDETLFPGLDPKTRERYAKAAEARIAAREEPDDGGVADLAAGVTARARAGADLMRRLKTDGLTEGDVAAAESLGEIDAATARRLRRELEASRDAGRRLLQDLSRAESAFAEGRKLNPKDPLDRGAIDRHYELIRKGWEEAGLSPEEVRPAIAEYIADSGVIPSDIERKLPFYLDNGTPEQKWEAADLIRLLIEDHEFDLQEMPIGYRRKALGIAELVRRGHEPTHAVERFERLRSHSGDVRVTPLASVQSLQSAGESGLTNTSSEPSPFQLAAFTPPNMAGPFGSPREEPPPVSSPQSIGEIRADFERRKAKLSPESAKALDDALSAIERELPNLSDEDRNQLEGVLQRGKVDVAALPIVLAPAAVELVAVYGLPLAAAALIAIDSFRRTGQLGQTAPLPPSGPATSNSSPRANAPADQSAGPGERRDAIQMRPEDTIIVDPIAPQITPEPEQLIPEPAESGPMVNIPAGLSPEDLIEFVPANPPFEIPPFVESRGNPKTQRNNSDLARAAEAARDETGNKHEHTGGAFDKDGNKLKETYFPNRHTGGRLGSNRGDVVIKHPETGRLIIISTHDSLANGQPTGREADSASRLLINKNSGDYLLMIPKLRDGETLDVEAFKEFIKPLLDETAKPWDPNSPSTSQWIGGRFVK